MIQDHALTVQLIPVPEAGGYAARVPDIPAYRESDTSDEAIAALLAALRGDIEAIELENAMSRVSSPKVQTVNCTLTELAKGEAATHKSLEPSFGADLKKRKEQTFLR